MISRPCYQKESGKIFRVKQKVVVCDVYTRMEGRVDGRFSRSCVSFIHSFCKHEASWCWPIMLGASCTLYQCNALQNSSFSFSLELVCNMMKPISSQRLVSSSLGEIWGNVSTGFSVHSKLLHRPSADYLLRTTRQSSSHSLCICLTQYTPSKFYLYAVLPGYFQVEFIWNIPRRCSEYWAWWQSKNNTKLSKIKCESIGVMIVKYFSNFRNAMNMGH